jgi:hypothetical protein
MCVEEEGLKKRHHSMGQNFLLTVVRRGCEGKAFCPNPDAMRSGSPNRGVSSPNPAAKASTWASLAELPNWVSQVETWYCNKALITKRFKAKDFVSFRFVVLPSSAYSQ